MKIIGMSVVGSGEADRWLNAFIKHLKSRCDEVVICLNNPDSKTERLVKSNTYWVEDNREWGFKQPYIKEDFLEKVVRKFKPDWIIWLDCDEFLESRLSRSQLEVLASMPYDIAYYFWCVELWDSENAHRPDYMFDDVRFFKPIKDKLQFRKTPVHCGMAPEVNYHWGTHSQYYFKHYGLLKKEDRLKKYQRYQKYDSKNIYLTKEWYDSLLANGVSEPFNHEEFIKKSTITFFRKKPIMIATALVKPKKIYRFINPHGQLVIFDQERHYRHALKWQGFKFLGEEDAEVINRNEQPVVDVNPSQEVVEEKPVEGMSDFKCDECDFVGKSKKSLAIHKGKNHKKVSV